MALAPVTADRINIAKEFGLQNVEHAAVACRTTDLPFWAACALLEKESGGANVWGGADKSPYIQMNKLKTPINEDTFNVFYAGVLAGLVPTGVGPCQITYAGSLKTRADGTKYRDGGYFRVMIAQGLKPWVPVDNMTFGFNTLWINYMTSNRSWVTAGRLYNGRLSYGEDYLDKCFEWKDRLKVPGSINP